MRKNSLGRWVVRLSVAAALGIFVLSAAHRYTPDQVYTPNDVVWISDVVSTVPAAR
jgi:hypothetical protein